ncbi:hypothetical protein JCM11641_000697 [Rhodosporidiobolus odoratus]
MLARSASRLVLRPNCIPAASSSPQLFAPMSTAQSGPVESAIRINLTSSLSPAFLSITNDSHLHRHHAPMRASGGGNGETHFSVQVVSEKFEGLRMIQRHRLVNDSLKEQFDQGLHALSIKAKSPNEYEAAGEQL